MKGHDEKRYTVIVMDIVLSPLGCFGAHSAAHLAGAADDVGAAFATVLAAFKADETFNCTNEAFASCSSTAETACLVLVFMLAAHGRGGVQCIHLDGLAGLRRSGLSRLSRLGLG